MHMVFFITFKLLKTLTNNIKYSRQAVPFFFHRVKSGSQFIIIFTCTWLKYDSLSKEKWCIIIVYLLYLFERHCPKIFCWCPFCHIRVTIFFKQSPSSGGRIVFVARKRESITQDIFKIFICFSSFNNS